MTISIGAKRRLADLVMGHAQRRLRGQRPDWAEAMMREAEELDSDDERLRWSTGCAYASYRAPAALDDFVYPVALMAGVALMSAYQWSADEGLGTVAVICMIGVLLGVLEPRRNLLSAAAIGAVVTAVNGFETLTGIKPTYEIRFHSLVHDAKWTVFIAPALVACIVGRYAGQVLRSTPDEAA